MKTNIKQYMVVVLDVVLPLVAVGLFFAIGVFLLGDFTKAATPVVTDEHSCLVQYDYRWCPVKNRCVRSWEEPCEGLVSPEVVGVLQQVMVGAGAVFSGPTPTTFSWHAMTGQGIETTTLDGLQITTTADISAEDVAQFFIDSTGFTQDPVQQAIAGTTLRIGMRDKSLVCEVSTRTEHELRVRCGVIEPHVIATSE